MKTSVSRRKDNIFADQIMLKRTEVASFHKYLKACSNQNVPEGSPHPPPPTTT